jgi:hypothetical protein
MKSKNSIFNGNAVPQYDMQANNISPIPIIKAPYRIVCRNIGISVPSITNNASTSFNLELDDNYPKKIEIFSVMCYDSNEDSSNLIQIQLPNLLDHTSIFASDNNFSTINPKLLWTNTKLINNTQTVNFTYMQTPGSNQSNFQFGPTLLLSINFYY